MSISDKLLEARDRIAEQGWTQGQSRTAFGSVCIGYAASKVAIEEEDTMASHTPYGALEVYCYLTYNRNVENVNDHLLTSQEEALEVLEQAAKWAAEREGGSE